MFDYRQSTFTKGSPLVACKPTSGPALFNPPGFEIVDVPELQSIFILNIAGPHSWRVVYMDGRAHPTGDALRPTFLGHSIGRWEADTLVIDTVGFNEKTWISGAFPNTERLHLTGLWMGKSSSTSARTRRELKVTEPASPARLPV